MLCSDRESDRVRLDSLLKEFLRRILGMSSGTRMNNKRLHISNICKQGEQFQMVYEFACFLVIALDIECENRAAVIRIILLIKFLLSLVL